MPSSGSDIVGQSSLFNQTDWFTRGDVSFLIGKKTIYHSCWVKSSVASTDNVPWALGQITGATPLFQRHDIAGTVDQSKCWSWGYIFTDGSARFETKADTGSNTAMQHVAFQIAPSAKPRMWINGVEQVAEYLDPASGPWPSGGLAINNTTHDLWIGRGSVNSRLWDGLIDEVRIIEDIKDTAYVQTEYANLANIDDFVIFGDTETPSTRSPWNELVTGIVEEPNTLRFAADQFLENPTSDTPTLEAITIPNKGTALKVNDSLIDYKAIGGDGLATFKTTYEAANKRVIAPIRITVLPIDDIIDVSGEIPLPTSFVSTATVSGDASLTNEINSHGGTGYKLINLQNGNYGARTITKAGIYLKAVNLNGAIFTGELKLNGANNIVSRTKHNTILTLDGDNARAHRVFRTGGASTFINGIDCKGLGNIVDGCEITNTGWGIKLSDSCRSPIVNRCWIHDNGGPGGDHDASIYLGESKSTSLTKFNSDISYTRIERGTSSQRIEIKGSYNRVHHCHIIGGQIYVRHGLNNRFEFCWGDDTLFSLCDDCDRAGYPPGSRVLKCVTTGSGSDSGAHMRRGTITGDQLRSGTDGYPYCEDGLVIAHTGQLVLGNGVNGGSIMPKRTIIEVPAGITNIIKQLSSIADPIVRPLSITIPKEEAAKKLTPNTHCGQLWDTP